MNLTWAFSDNVSIYPTWVDVKFATVSNAAKNLWTTLETVPGTQTYYLWQIPQSSATDKFLIRLVPDHKETFTIGFIGKAPCFGDGMVMPTV